MASCESSMVSKTRHTQSYAAPRSRETQDSTHHFQDAAPQGPLFPSAVSEKACTTKCENLCGARRFFGCQKRLLRSRGRPQKPMAYPTGACGRLRGWTRKAQPEACVTTPILDSTTALPD